MSWILVLAIMVITGVTMRASNSSTPASEPVIQLNSLCVVDSDGKCYTEKLKSEGGPPTEGMLCLSSSDFVKITEKLKSCK